MPHTLATALLFIPVAAQDKNAALVTPILCPRPRLIP
jgi:hypothetical protein